jgi:hypothetical protein
MDRVDVRLKLVRHSGVRRLEAGGIETYRLPLPVSEDIWQGVGGSRSLTGPQDLQV